MRIDARPLILIAALSAGPALAQEVEGVISTQTATAAPPTGLTTEQKIANILAAAPKDENAPVEPEIGPRKVHGGVEVSVGTGGYRAGYAYAVIPVGDTGTLGVAYGQSQGGRAYAGPGRRGGPRGRGDSQSLGLSLSFDADKASPDGCAPSFKDGARPIEPLWATQMRGRNGCAVAD